GSLTNALQASMRSREAGAQPAFPPNVVVEGACRCAGGMPQRSGCSCGSSGRRSRDAPTRRAGTAETWSQTPPVTNNPMLLRIIQLLVGRRASGFVLVALVDEILRALVRAIP